MVHTRTLVACVVVALLVTCAVAHSADESAAVPSVASNASPSQDRIAKTAATGSASPTAAPEAQIPKVKYGGKARNMRGESADAVDESTLLRKSPMKPRPISRDNLPEPFNGARQLASCPSGYKACFEGGCCRTSYYCCHDGYCYASSSGCGGTCDSGYKACHDGGCCPYGTTCSGDYCLDGNGGSSSSSCISGSSTVRVQNEDGSVVRETVRNLKPGQLVQVMGSDSKVQFEPVLAFTHYVPEKKVQQFVSITAGDSTLTLTPGHFVMLPGGASARADDVKVGDTILLAAEDDTTAKEATVDAVQAHTQFLDAYSFLTMSGTTVVDGVVASSYSALGSHYVSHLLNAPARHMYTWLGERPLPESQKEDRILSPWVKTALTTVFGDGSQ